jgi:hypothetical protein
MSVFDGIDFSVLECSRAEKNIADDWDRKHITTRLEFKDEANQLVFAVRSSYTISEDLTTMFEEAIKISCDNFKESSKIRLRVFGEHSVSKDLKKDLDIIEKLFHNAPNEVKRVY